LTAPNNSPQFSHTGKFDRRHAPRGISSPNLRPGQLSSTAPDPQPIGCACSLPVANSLVG